MSDHESEPLLASIHDGVMTVSLNRPHRHNAVNGALHDGLRAAFAQARADATVRVVVLRGEGRSFCSGGDVADFAQGVPAEAKSPAQRALQVMDGRDLIESMLSVPQPIVCAARGYSMGLGATIALFSDVVIAAEDAVFADSHVNVGLVAGDGGAVVWPLLAGLGRARYHLLTGERVSGALAAEWGLVYKAVPAEDVEQETRKVVDVLAGLAPMAVRGTKATLNRIVRERLELLLDYGLWSESVTFLSEDHAEASRAFVEKRTPRFLNR